MNERPDLDQGHGVRFEKVITRHIRRIAEASSLTYSEMTRVLVDEAILARLTRTDLDRYVLREAVLHALEHQPRPEGPKYTYTPIVDFEKPVLPLTEIFKDSLANNSALLQELMQQMIDENDPAVRAIREEEKDSGWTTITPGS